MADFPTIPAGMAIPLVDTDTWLFPEPTMDALNATIAETGVPRSLDDHTYVWIAGVMRNDGSGWAFLPVGTNHRPINVDSVEIVGSTLRVNYASIGAAMTVVAMAQPDEALTGAGFSMGCSVTPDRTDITIYQDIPQLADYISWDGTQWVSALGVFTVTSWTSGVLRLSHASIPGNGSYDVAITPRGSNWDIRPRVGSPAINSTDIYLEVRDTSPEIQGEVSWNGSAWLVPSGWSAAFSSGVLTVTHPAIGPGASQRFVANLRGSGARVELSAGGSPMTTTTIALAFRDSAGTALSVENTAMRIWLQRGGGLGAPTTTAQTGMAFWIRNGGGKRLVAPSTIDTTAYPLSNIWFYAIMGMEGGA